MKKALFITTFTGNNKLIDSFISSKQECDLLVCYNSDFSIKHKNIITYPLYINKYLQKIIKTHNLYPSLKIASIKYGIENYESKYEYIIFIDENIYFNKFIPLSFFDKNFINNKLIFGLINKEIKLISFNIKMKANNIIRRWIIKYKYDNEMKVEKLLIKLCNEINYNYKESKLLLLFKDYLKYFKIENNNNNNNIIYEKEEEEKKIMIKNLEIKKKKEKEKRIEQRKHIEEMRIKQSELIIKKRKIFKSEQPKPIQLSKRTILKQQLKERKMKLKKKKEKKSEQILEQTQPDINTNPIKTRDILKEQVKMKNKILFVTSFSEKIYSHTGKKLINTFLSVKQPGDLLVCYENFNFKSKEDNIITYPLHTDLYLKKWLIKNKEIIPTDMGGLATKKNRPDIINNVYRRNASRWFRKMASIKYALENYKKKYNYIIWVDSDCYFLDKIPISFLMNVFENTSMFYYEGKYRRDHNQGYETGFVGFNQKEGGYNIIEYWIKDYEYIFKRYENWGDGNILQKVCDRHKFKKTKDLAISNESSPMSRDNIFSDYIVHKKGVHGRKKLFK